MKELICPYCRGKDVTIWAEKINPIDKHTVIGQEGLVKVYRCYTCGQFFDVRHIVGCGDKIFTYGDNFPKISWNKPAEMEEHKKFKCHKPITKDDIINMLIDLFRKEKNNV